MSDPLLTHVDVLLCTTVPYGSRTGWVGVWRVVRDKGAGGAGLHLGVFSRLVPS
jgi:hypothetical protein